MNKRTNTSSAYKRRAQYKKPKFGYLKVLAIILALTVFILIIFTLTNLFTTKAYAEPLVTSNKSGTTELVGSTPVYENYSAPNLNSKNQYLAEQSHLLKNIQRVDVNTAISMNYYDIVNLYPDSINSAKALENNFTEYGSVLSPDARSNEGSLINEICTDNTNYINAIITYNKLLTSNGSYSAISAAKNTVSLDFQAVNNLINNNINSF